MNLKYVFLGLLILLLPLLGNTQCTNGSQPECTCQDAPVLCSINELDGYQFSMDSYQHPQDGPNPLCGGSWVPNNPTWFSFIAWCDELTITVEIDNCTPMGGSNGVQVGVYSDCNTFAEVDCIGNDCGNTNDKVLDVGPLVIGEVYHFMIDGCAGSYCDVTISVDGACTEEIEDWTNGITGDTEVCQGESIDYEVDNLTGATSYHWYVDGAEESVTDDPEETITWDTPGEYELCVDVSNECIDESEDPEQICETITVVGVDAGHIVATPNPLCPGETSDVTVSAFNMDPGVSEVIIITDPNGVVLDVITGSTTTSITYDLCGDITVYSLNYADFENIVPPSIGGSYNGTDCTGKCCDEISEIISFEDDTDPMFTNPPADETLICFDGVMPMPDLECTDDCGPTKMVMGVEMIDADLCDGGTITREWMCIDTCGNESIHIQTISIDPVIVPDYINPPGDVSIVCSGTVPPAIDLMYTNGGMGSCLIDGTVPPVESGTPDICGSVITYEWDFTDACGNNLNHVQTITIEESEQADFINPPGDEIISCDEPVPPPIDLDYNNNGTGGCLISGTVSPVVSGTYDACGSIITYEWDFTDACGRNINHVQTIEIIPAEEPSYINPPSDMTMTCPDYDAFSFSDLDYANSNAMPCDISGTVMPMITDNTNDCGGTVEAFYTYTDDCGRTIDHTQTITIEPPEEATFLSPPADITVSCDAVPPPAGPLSYSNNEVPFCLISGSEEPVIVEDYDVCGGTITNTWEYIDDCGRVITEEQVITVDPAPPPMFTQSPPDMTLDCEEFNDFTPINLPYTNGENGFCLISGAIVPTANGSITECGGVITYTWQYTDNCGRFIEFNQDITVLPAPPATFNSSPADMTLDCSEANDPIPMLGYTNGEDGICLISGSVSGIPSGVVNECGGIIDYTWTFQDNCGRVITETQQITYLPGDEPEFIDPPEDLTVACDDEVMDPELLSYDNELDSPCQIAGDVSADINIVDNIYEYTWTYTNPCSGNVISHTQTIEKLLPLEWADDEFEFVICAGLEFDLSSVNLVDLHGTAPEITFHDELPHDPGNEIDPEVEVDFPATEYYIVGTNEYGCFDVATVLLTPDEEVYAGDDIEDEFCIGTDLLDLYTLLTFSADTHGEFTLESGQDLDIIDPSAVNVSNAEPGIYQFLYYVQSAGTCPDDEAYIELELFDAIDIELISIACAPDGLSYTVVISNDSYQIDVSQGDITEETNTQITIENIPINTSITIEALEPFSRCSAEITFNSPNCSCPTVPAPVSLGNKVICQGDLNPILEVTVAPDATANWHDSPSGGNILASNTTQYQPLPTSPGIYTFYVEAESTIQAGCYSANRTPVRFEIIPLPAVRDTFLNICDIDNDGYVTVMQNTLTQLVTFGLSNLDISFFSEYNGNASNSEALIFPFVNDSLEHQIIFAEIFNSADCKRVIEVDIIINPSPRMDPVVQDEQCFAQSNGSILINTTAGTEPILLIFDGDTLMSNNVNQLEPNIYTIVAVDSLGCRDTIQAEILEGIALEFSSLSYTCNDNGTSSDATDDTYDIEFLVSNSLNTAGDYTLELEGMGIVGTYAYGTTNSITVAANEMTLLLTIADAMNMCSEETTIGPLNSCSSDCIISLDLLDANCNDNGSPYDPLDDYYVVDIEASAINGSSVGTYNVLLNNVVTYNYSYGTVNSFNVPADGTNLTIQVTDSQFSACFTSQVLSSLVSCSDACLLEGEILDITCNNNGTQETSDDDIFNANIMASGFNTGTTFSIPTLSVTGNYDESINLGPFTIADGNVEIILIDDMDPSCQDTLLLIAPSPCSDPCTLEFDYFNSLACDDNGTPQDESDDFFTVNFSVLAVDGNVSSFMVVDNLGNNYGSFSYNSDVNIGPLPANNSMITLTITDPANGTCLLENTVSSAPCSDLCSLTANVNSIVCDNASTLDDNDDDTFNAEIIVTGINTGTGYNITDPSTSGTYGQPLNLSGFLISDGNVVLEIVDADNPDCMTTLQLNAPSPCSEPCTISFNSFEVLDCNDNSTTTDGSDDFYSISFNIGVTDGVVSQFVLTDNNNIVYGPFDYNTDIELGPFPANGMVTSFDITDLVNGTCILQESASSQPCSDLCVINAMINSINCNDAGTQGSNDDDTFTAAISVTGINNSGSFEIQPLGITANYGEQVNLAPMLIADGNVQLIIVDSSNGLCRDTINLVAPGPCSSPCEISIASLDILSCNDNGTGNIATDDFYQIDLEVTSVLGAGANYIINDNLGNSYGPFNYGTVTQVGPFPANGNSIALTITDPTNGSCLIQSNISGDPCSSCEQTAQLMASTLILDCDNSSSNITVQSSEAPVSYQWVGENNFMSDLETITVSQAGQYAVTLTYADGCTVNDAIVITSNDDTPFAVGGPDLVIDCENESVILDGSSSTLTSNTLIEWIDEDGNVLSNEITFEVDEIGSYGLLLTDIQSNCVAQIDIVEVTENMDTPSSIIYANPGNILDCRIQSVILTTDEEENTIYNWKIENVVVNTSNTFILTEPAVVILVAIDTISACESSSDIELLDLTAYPIIEFGDIEDIGCESAEVCIEVSSIGPSSNLDFNWLDSNGNVISTNNGQYCTTQPGEYSIELIDQDNGCTNKDTFFIEGPIIPSVQLPQIISLNVGETPVLNPQINLDISEISEISWITTADLSCYDCLNPTLLNYSDGDVLQLSITSVTGCNDIASVPLEVIDIERVRIYVPNIFTPDTRSNFTIFTNDKIDLIQNMYIYDRWGELIFTNQNFKPNDPDLGWDGYFNDKKAEQGVYVYLFVFEVDGKVETWVGDITLLW